jgi:hypothetical protein
LVTGFKLRFRGAAFGVYGAFFRKKPTQNKFCDWGAVARRRFLDEARAGNPRMRARVEDLLAWSEQIDAFFATAAAKLIELAGEGRFSPSCNSPSMSQSCYSCPKSAFPAS